jgi:hypothetical protein
MTFVIQLRGRHWAESMGWQDMDFVPDDRTPAEWVAMMNEGDPQIEYRLSPVVNGRMFLGLDEPEVVVVVDGLKELAELLSDDVAWGSATAERRLSTIRTVLLRIDALSTAGGQ